jgi:plastocyanin
LDAKLASATASSTYAALTGAAFTGNVQLQEVSETIVDVTLSSNAATLDWTAGNVYYIATAPSAAMTFNVTNIPTTVSRINTINVFVTQGSTGYIPSTFQIGGVGQTIRWANGGAPTPTSSAGKIDIFSFTMQRTSGGAWLVYGAASLNF